MKTRASRHIHICTFVFLLFAVPTAFLMDAPVARAQERTGTIEGTITDPSGASIAGASVKIEGPGFTQSTVTDAGGFFRVLQVPPGTYNVTVKATNFSSAAAEAVNVILGKTTTVALSLKTGAVEEVVVVTGESVSRVDTTDNQVQTNITAKTIENLPKGTNFTSLLKLSPATRAEPLSGQFQIDGASGSENSFIIDGQEVSNFRTGVINFNNNLPFQFVQEVQIKTSGFEAQYGGATGGVVNLVTKGGDNEFHGEAGYQWEPGGLWGNPRKVLNSFRTGTGASFLQINEYLRPKNDSFTNHFPYGTVSGPIIKNKLWFLASYAPQIFNTSRTSNYLTSDPRTRTQTASVNYSNSVRQEYGFVRLDAEPVNKLRLTGTFTWNPQIQDGVLPNGNIVIGGVPPSANFGGSIGTLSGSDLARVQGGRQNANNVTFAAVYTPTNNLVTTFRFSRGFLNEKLNSYNIPDVTRFICTGSNPPAAAGCALGFQNVTNNSQIAYDVSYRTNYEADASYLVSNFGGRHEFKGGYQNIKVENDVLRGYTKTGIVQLFYGNSINDLAPIELPVSRNAIGAGFLRRFGTVGAASNKAQSIYIQDKWQPIKRLTINAGVRFEKEDLPSFNGFAPPINFGFGDKIAPRVGVAFDPFGDGKGKIYFSYGRFLDRLKFELPRGSFGGDFFRDDYFEIINPRFDSYTLQAILGSNPDVLGGRCPITNSTGLSRCQADFRIASNDPNGDIFTGRVDPNLKPFTQTEYTVGFERELKKNYIFSVRYTYKNVDHAVEDAGFPTPDGSEAYIIGNPGEGLHAETAKQFGYVKTIKPQRRYDALEFRFDRRFANNYFFNLAYTYSRLQGNYSGLASSDEAGRTSPGVNRFFDLPFVGFTAAGRPDNGRLATDRPHVFNAFGGYDFKWFGKLKGQSTLLSFFTTAQSGTPLTSFFSFYSVTTILNGRGDLGRTEAFLQTDFSVSHRIKVKERYELGFTFNAINLFDQARVLGVSTQVIGAGTTNASNLSLGVPDERAAINLLLTNGILNQVNTFLNSSAAPQRRNTAFGLPNNFQGPRQIRFGVSFKF